MPYDKRLNLHLTGRMLPCLKLLISCFLCASVQMTSSARLWPVCYQRMCKAQRSVCCAIVQCINVCCFSLIAQFVLISLSLYLFLSGAHFGHQQEAGREGEGIRKAKASAQTATREEKAQEADCHQRSHSTSIRRCRAQTGSDRHPRRCCVLYCVVLCSVVTS